jgi:dTDP-4-dehydrorhamnose reductase
MQLNRILVIGGSGQLGQAMESLSSRYDTVVKSFNRDKLDLSSPTFYSRLMYQCKNFRPTVIVNCAAYTDVGAAEEDLSLAYQVNTTAVATMVEVCNRRKIPLIHISSDYTLAPTLDSVYARSKKWADDVVKAYCHKYAIVYVSALYSEHARVSFFKKIIDKLENREDPIEVAINYYCNPTYAYDVVAKIPALCRLIRHFKREKVEYFAGTHKRYSFAEFARAIAEAAGYDPQRIHGVFRDDAIRPKECTGFNPKRTNPKLAFSLSNCIRNYQANVRKQTED